MGRAKDWMIEQMERGYTYAEGEICSECVPDPEMAKWVKDNLTSTKCRFCDREEEDLIAASFDAFVGVIVSGISFDWNHPDAEGISYDGREGGYQLSLTDTYDLLCDYGLGENEKLFHALLDSIDNISWVERDYYWGDESQRLVWGWNSFKYLTKHQSRYLFLKSTADEHGDITPAEMLDAIASFITADHISLDLIKTITQDENLFRVRIGAEKFNDAGALGPPPEKVATQANRMSPAGIPMFYGAFDSQTAQAETFDPATHEGSTMSIGTWRATRNLNVLDLADLPDTPSVFDVDAHHLIHPLRFLHEFARDLAQPITRDGREHIEYVPTQIVTEYFRRVFRDVGDQPIDGIIYQSSRVADARAFVLFCDNEQCANIGHSGSQEDKLLELVAVDHLPCPPELPTAQ